MLTHKTMQELLFHYSLGQQNCSSAILFHSLNELSERLERIEALLEKRQRSESHQLRTYANTIILPPRPPNCGGSKSSSPQIWGARGAFA
jgi:hypothetical protein